MNIMNDYNKLLHYPSRRSKWIRFDGDWTYFPLQFLAGKWAISFWFRALFKGFTCNRFSWFPKYYCLWISLNKYIIYSNFKFITPASLFVPKCMDDFMTCWQAWQPSIYCRIAIYSYGMMNTLIYNNCWFENHKKMLTGQIS